MADLDPNKRSVLEHIQNSKNLILCEGIAFTLLGIFALMVPTFFSLTLNYFLGWVLVVGAIALGIWTFYSPQMAHRRVATLSTILYFFLGFMFLAYPVSGIAVLTLLLGCFFIFDGAIKIYGCIQVSPLPGWSFVLISGLISLVLAVLILSSWPISEIWLFGVLIGINLLSTGLASLALLWKISKIES
jgi:uncharacterized membrane protein HdeD (DUF308 family)